MDLSEWQQKQRESFSDVYLKVLTPVCCSELTDPTKTRGEMCMQADTEKERQHLFSLLTLTDGESKSFVGMRQTAHTL